MSGPPRINDTVHNQLDMTWSNSLDVKKQPWKTALGFVVLLAAVLLLTQVVPFALSSHTEGDTSRAEEIILPDPADEAFGVYLADVYPSGSDLTLAMDLVKNTFRKEFHNCALLSLTYDGEFSNSLSEELLARYDSVGVEKGPFVLTTAFTTGENPPAGLEPNTTYDSYQWVLADTGGSGEEAVALLDRGLSLLSGEG